MAMTLHLDIVSAEAEIFSGRVERLFAVGSLGELEIAPGHAALLTALQAGPVHLRLQGGKEEVVFVTGGLLEVQPEVATILADTVIRAHDFDEAQALKAKEQAERFLKDKHTAIEYAQARADLIRAAGMLRAIHKIQHRG